jgi:hypothetical protein
MRKATIAAAAVLALALAGTAAAALVPGTFDPGHACAGVTSTFSNGVLHLAKPCPTPTNASAGATITGVSGQTFTSASFTLASASQCQGGSPRFNVVTSSGTFFLGCNNVTPTTNSNGTVTYTFTAATLAAAGHQVPTPTGTISSVEVLIDVQGSADLSNITFNGVTQTPARTAHKHPKSKADCKNGGWKTFTNPSFKNQGRCVAFVERHSHHAKGDDDDRKHNGDRDHDKGRGGDHDNDADDR